VKPLPVRRFLLPCFGVSQAQDVVHELEFAMKKIKKHEKNSYFVIFDKPGMKELPCKTLRQRADLSFVLPLTALS